MQFGPICKVLARSSPDDKLTWAKGLNASLMIQDKERRRKLKVLEDIDVFLDSQISDIGGQVLASGCPGLTSLKSFRHNVL